MSTQSTTPREKDVLIESTGNHGLTDEPAYHRLKEAGWIVESVYLTLGRGQRPSYYHLLVRKGACSEAE